MSKPLISIVIPTKDRYNYLKILLKLIESFNSNEIEIVVQDNTADNKEILDFFSSNPSIKVVYDHTPQQIPISLNCDKAYLNSSGKYICFIGDDDGVTQHIIDCAHWMNDNNIDIVVPASISYNWPDAQFSNSLDNSGKLRFKPFDGSCVKKSTKEALDRALRYGFVERYGLPVSYHGIVSRKKLNEIYEKSGSFFPGQSPDIANAVALCLVSESFYVVNKPIVISGAGKSHSGGVANMKNKAGNIDEIPFLSPDAKKEWESSIPRVWTVETTWCESSVKSLRRMGREDLVEKVNFDYLYERFVAYHFPLRDMAFSLTANKLKVAIISLGLITQRYFNAAMRLLKVKTDTNQIVINNVEDIVEVVKILNEKYKC